MKRIGEISKSMSSMSRDQRGAVSILTVLFVALILTMVSVSTIRIMIRERRESTDTQLSTQAYYAAESGVEDAVFALNKFIDGEVGVELNEDSCDPAEATGLTGGLLEAEGTIEYTCQLIDLTPGDFVANLTQEGDAVTIPLQRDPADPAFGRLLVEWHLKADVTDGGDGTVVTTRDNSDLSLPVKTAWNNGGTSFPAMVSLNMFSYPKQGDVNRGNIDHHVAYLNPANATAAASTVNFADLDSATQNEPLNARCNAGVANGEYVCQFIVTGLDDGASGNNYFLRMQSFYTDTHIRLSLLPPAGNTPIAFDNVQALIDVTGRANDEFRRIEARVPLSPRIDLLPDFAITSAEGICKEIIIDGSVRDNCP